MTRLEKLQARLGVAVRSPKKAKSIYVDVGSHTTKIGVDGKTVFLQPTCFLRHRLNGSLVVAGEQAKKMLGKLPVDVIPVFPVRNGQVVDTDSYNQFIKLILEPFIPTGISLFLHPPKITTAVLFPDHLTQRRVVEQGIRQISRKVSVVPMATALWKNLSAQHVFTEEGCVVDIGGMTTKVYVFAEGQLSVGEVYEFGGDDWTMEVIQSLRQEYHLEIGWLTAEQLKHSFAPFASRDQKHTVQGKDIVTSLPTTKVVDSGVFKVGSDRLVQRIVQSFEDVCQMTSPELLSRVLERGIYLTGGGSQMQGLGTSLERTLKLPVIVSKQPQEEVIHGLMVRTV